MKEIFGLPTTGLMVALLVLLGIALLTVAVIALTRPTMFRMGIRNLPRRGLQTGLIVVGLALATLITTASFVTGDTIDHSLTADSYGVMGRSDIDITWNGQRKFDTDTGSALPADPVYLRDSVVADLEARFPAGAGIEAFLPFIQVQAPVTNPRSGYGVPSIQLMGSDPARIDSVGGLTRVDGGPALLADLRPNEVYLSERAARQLHARTGDALLLHIEGQARSVTVAAIVEDELASGVLGLSYSSVPGGMAMPADRVREIYGLEPGAISSLTVALESAGRGSLGEAETVAALLREYIEGDGAPVFVGDRPASVEVFTTKLDLVKDGEANGQLFTTLFLVLGLFSMVAGIMLIFMIFVMLAAERKAEMGMARAVGAQRGDLVRSFVAEGMAYSLVAGVIGVVLGVGAAYALTEGFLKLVGGEYFSLVEFRMTPVSVVIGYSLGVVITFVTVVFASMKVSHVNIVAAIRQLPDEHRRSARRKTRWGWVLAGIPALAVPPLGLWLLLRKGFGLSWAWVVGPSGLALGAVLMLLGKSSETLFFFAAGISLLPLSVAAMARHLGLPQRALWTTVGLLLAAYWLMPESLHSSLFGTFNSDIEMFSISGLMIVIGFTLVIVFNAGVLARLFSRSGDGAAGYTLAAAVGLTAVATAAVGVAMHGRGDGLGDLAYLAAGLLAPLAVLTWAGARFPSLGPALKMSVAYPLANRFRTGMTIAMFSIIVFSLTVFSVLLANFDTAFNGGDARGGIDIMATSTAGQSFDDLPGTLAGVGSPAAGQVTGIGRTTVYTGASLVSRVGSGQPHLAYPVLAADDGFFRSLRPVLHSFAEGYASEEQVLDAVASGHNLALVDSTAVGVGFNDAYDWSPGVSVEDGRFEPFEVELLNTATGESVTVTVIGALKVGLPSSHVAGVHVNEATYRGAFGDPAYSRLYARVVEGADSVAVAAAIQSALATQGLQAESVQKLLDDQSAQTVTFNRMFQAFMALGLIVGIAGLGVIAFRSVVERRQQIGMLRAIGYQRATVSLTFILESTFIAAMGILSGVVGGAVLGRNLLNSRSFTDGATIHFAMPWAEILVIVGASFVFSLLMTWWPSRGASRVPVAEALRYE